MRGFPPVSIGARRQTTFVERSFRTRAEVLVGHGKRVRPSDVVAVSEVLGHPFAIPVSDLLGSAEKEAQVRFAKQVGEAVSVGECVALRRGFFGREKAICPSPEAGTVAGLNVEKGFVVISPAPVRVELLAGVDGTVAEILPGRGVVLAVSGLYGEAAIMIGAEVSGTLRVSSEGAAGALTSVQNSAGRVLLAGHADDAALALAEKEGAAGVVVGGVSQAAWRGLRQGKWPRLTVSITDGVGVGGMYEPSYAEFASAEGSAVLLTRQQSRFGSIGHPQMIVALPSSAYPESRPPQLELGAAVRVVAGHSAGEWGRVAGLPTAPVRAQVGRAGYTASVVLVNGTQVSVPVANLELMG